MRNANDGTVQITVRSSFPLFPFKTSLYDIISTYLSFSPSVRVGVAVFLRRSHKALEPFLVRGRVPRKCKNVPLAVRVVGESNRPSCDELLERVGTDSDRRGAHSWNCGSVFIHLGSRDDVSLLSPHPRLSLSKRPCPYCGRAHCVPVCLSCAGRIQGWARVGAWSVVCKMSVGVQASCLVER